jgi:hypothetical protein
MEEPPASVHRQAFPDPRVFRAPGEIPQAASWHELAARSLGAETTPDATRCDAALRHALAPSIAREPDAVEAAIDGAPSPFLARKLWRTVDEIISARPDSDAIAITLFALPVVIVAGVREGTEPLLVHGVLRDTAPVVAALRAQRLLGGNDTFAISAGLVPAASLAITTLPRWQALRRIGKRLDDAQGDASGLLSPSSLRVPTGAETVHLRFLIGSAVAAASVDVLATAGATDVALTRALVDQLAVAGASLLPLPRPPQSLLRARHDGLVAQREVSAQLFASNAIRSMRASSGEPTAVISAHRAADAPGGGELRLSLSSPFDARDAEGFRCPVYSIEAVTTPLRMLVDLLRDCRVQDVRFVAGVHPDRAAGGGLLLFKPDTVPEGMLLQ